MPDITPPADDKQGTTAQAGGTGGPVGKSEPRKLEFTQDEFDRIIAERVARAKPKDYDELVALKAQADAEAEARKTALEKATEARIEAERKAQDRVSAADAKLKRAAVLAEAVAQKAADPEIVALLLATSEEITVDEVGEVSGVREAVKKLLRERPVLAGGAPARSGGEFGGVDTPTLPAKVAEAEARGDHREARRLKLSQIIR